MDIDGYINMRSKHKYDYVVTFNHGDGIISRWCNGKLHDYRELPTGFNNKDLMDLDYYIAGTATLDSYLRTGRILSRLFRMSRKKIESLMLSFRLTDEPICGNIKEK